MDTTPFWQDDFPRPHDLPVAGDLPAQVDVAIIGGGYTGLNAARVLAQSGAKVAVFERQTIGWGASSRNGGMATPGLKQGIKTVFKWYGEERGREFWQTSLDALTLIDEIVRQEELDCDWSCNGYVALAYKASHFAQMQESVSWYKEKLDYSVRAIGRDELRSEIGSDAYYGGVVGELGGGIHPAKYVYGLARAAARYGALLYEEADVIRIDRRTSGFALTTGKGVVGCSEIIVATNGYTNNLLPKLRSRIFPVGSYCIVTEPLSAELQASLSPKQRMFYDSKRFLNYFRLTADGRFLWGGRNNLSTDLDLRESAASLQAQMLERFPQLRGTPITHSWTGQLGLTFDLMPHIGRIGGVHYALGYGGHGLSMATYLGTEIALLLSGQKSRSPFAEIPHNGRWFYPLPFVDANSDGQPLFVPLAAQYYRFLDWIS